MITIPTGFGVSKMAGRFSRINQTRRKILVLEDDPCFHSLLKIYLKDAGYEVSGVCDFQTSLERCEIDPPDLLIIDLCVLQKFDSTPLFKIKGFPDLFGHPRIIFISGSDDGTLFASYLKEKGEIDYCFRKPFEFEALDKKIRELLEGKMVPDQPPAGVGQSLV